MPAAQRNIESERIIGNASLFFRVLAFMVLLNVAGPEWSTASQTVPPSPAFQPEPAVKNSSRETYNGREYTKINLGELFQLCLDKDADKISGHYVLRGIARRTPELDSEGQFAFIRTAIVCCEAHAAPVGFRVSTHCPHEIKDGQWVKIYGVLEKLPPGLPKANLQSAGLLFTRFNTSYGIVPHNIVNIPKPDDPSIRQFRSCEPYAY